MALYLSSDGVAGARAHVNVHRAGAVKICVVVILSRGAPTGTCTVMEVRWWRCRDDGAGARPHGDVHRAGVDEVALQ